MRADSSLPTGDRPHLFDLAIVLGSEAVPGLTLAPEASWQYMRISHRCNLVALQNSIVRYRFRVQTL